MTKEGRTGKAGKTGGGTDIIEAAAASIRDRLGARKPRIAVVLGSGLGFLTEHIEDPVMIPYGEIPGFPPTTVIGHGAELVAGVGGVAAAVTGSP